MKTLNFEVIVEKTTSTVLIKINGEILFKINPQNMSEVKVTKDVWIENNETQEEILELEDIFFSVKETKFKSSNIWDDVSIMAYPNDVVINIEGFSEQLASPESDTSFIIHFGNGDFSINPIKWVKEIKRLDTCLIVELYEERN